MLNMRKFLLILLSLSLLSCQFASAIQEKISTPIVKQLPTADVFSSTKVNVPEPSINQTSGLTIVALKPSDGDLNDQLADHSKRAKGLNQMPVVDFTATWC